MALSVTILLSRDFPSETNIESADNRVCAKQAGENFNLAALITGIGSQQLRSAGSVDVIRNKSQSYDPLFMLHGKTDALGDSPDKCM